MHNASCEKEDKFHGVICFVELSVLMSLIAGRISEISESPVNSINSRQCLHMY